VAASEGRRPRKSSAARRADVLAAARRLFAERGFHATSTRDLAEAADINDALLYRYFPGKDAILAALVDEAVAAFRSLPPARPAPGLPVADLLEFIGQAFVATVTAQLDLLTILISEHHALADDHRFVEFIDHAAVGLGQLLDNGGGPQDPGSGYLTARSYMGSLIAFVIAQDVLGLSAAHPVDPAAYIHHLATLTARGLAAGR
jgi:AcrR family transcriptional regulator